MFAATMGRLVMGWSVGFGLLANVSLFAPNVVFGIFGPVALGLAGLFTLRKSLGSYWKDRAEEMEARSKDYEEKYREQRALKHEALSKLAAEELKTDVSGVLGEVVRLHKEFTQRGDVFREILQVLAEQREEQVTTMAQVSADLQRIGETLEAHGAAITLILEREAR